VIGDAARVGGVVDARFLQHGQLGQRSGPTTPEQVLDRSQTKLPFVG
jgi:hypothetical protein